MTESIGYKAEMKVRVLLVRFEGAVRRATQNAFFLLISLVLFVVVVSLVNSLLTGASVQRWGKWKRLLLVVVVACCYLSALLLSVGVYIAQQAYKTLVEPFSGIWKSVKGVTLPGKARNRQGRKEKKENEISCM